MSETIGIGVLLLLTLSGGSVLLRWGMRWGSTPAEHERTMPGDELLDDDRRARVAMTRAISIDAPPGRVWPWVAQLGRGAGWYSVDWLDNGRRVSAWHIVSWIPEPRLGDATGIGYLRHLEPERAICWWLDAARFVGAPVRMVTSYRIDADDAGSRLISRISADASGPTARVAMWAFAVIDSIMACRQLIGLRDRAEHAERSHPGPRDPETGARDQYQLYEVIYADGEGAGVAGREHGAEFRLAAIRDGVLEAADREAR